MTEFTCNVCGEKAHAQENVAREAPSCSHCGCSARTRGLLLSLSRVLFNGEFALPHFPKLRTLKGLGISDSPEYALTLEQRFNYTNTFYHQQPFLDIQNPPPDEHGRYDFIICSDVIEHVPAPVDAAIQGLRTLLKPTGFLIVTVPYHLGAETTERFPTLLHHSLVNVGGKTVLVGRTAEDAFEVHDQLVFHMGHGATLEHRQFSESGLLQAFRNQGFTHARIDAAESPAYGVHYDSPCSLPLVAAQQEFTLPPATTAELVQELMKYQGAVTTAAGSRWFQLGRRLGLGPRLDKLD